MRDLPTFLADVQTSVLRGVDAQVVAYLFFRITNRRAFVEALPAGPGGRHGVAVKAARFRSESHRLQATGDAEQPAFHGHAHIAFTYTGLEKLGVHALTLASFPEPFRDGMAARAASLGDEGDAAPDRWDGYLGSRAVHGVAWFNIRLPDNAEGDAIQSTFGTLSSEVRAAIPDAWRPATPPLPPTSQAPRPATTPVFDAGQLPGAEVLHIEFGMANYRCGDNGERYRVEHFGFRDGISQPFAEIGLQPPAPGGGTPRPGDSWAPLALGELLLGHADEDGLVQHLPANRNLRDNGTYIVLRKLEQDVVGFRNFLKLRDRSGKVDWLAAQMIGRWPDGTPVVRCPNGPQAEMRYASDPAAVPPTATINDFRYQRDDPLGRRCPIGAHIRRANPRDTNDRDEARRHRIFRRGISYGGPLLPQDSTGDGHARGLLFVAMQARLDRQFEFIQANWLNRGEFAGQAGARRDPVTGRHGGGLQDAFQPVGQPAPVTHLPRFVIMRGGDYFFVPSFTALAQFKANSSFPPDDLQAPQPEDALGTIRPTQTDTTKDLIALGKRLLSSSQSFERLPPLTTQRYPGGTPVVQNTIVVAQHAYVRTVLADSRNFSMRPFDVRARRMTGGDRLLIGLEPGEPERTKRLAFLHEALAHLAPLPVAATAERLAAAALERVKPLGRLDVVKDLGRVVPILCAGALFGVPGPTFLSPTAIAAQFGRLDVTDMPDDWLRTLPSVEDYAKPLATMQAWTRMTFLEMFVNIVDAEEIAAAAERATREFMRHLDSLILKARGAPARGSPRTLLEALVRVPLDPSDGPNPERHARLLLAEFTAGSVETVNAALANIIDYLLDYRDQVTEAIRAHLEIPRGDRATTLDALIGRMRAADLDTLIKEILRLAPMGPLAFRECVGPTNIGGAAVEPGTLVCLVPAAAMVDERVFPEPQAIRFDRPPEAYLHFGTGAHACAGQMILPIALPMLRVLFRAVAGFAQLRRAAGPAGNKAQTFPVLADGLTVRFRPQGSPAR